MYKGLMNKRRKKKRDKVVSVNFFFNCIMLINNDVKNLLLQKKNDVKNLELFLTIIGGS
jgi:hypothetical protein